MFKFFKDAINTIKEKFVSEIKTEADTKKLQKEKDAEKKTETTSQKDTKETAPKSAASPGSQVKSKGSSQMSGKMIQKEQSVKEEKTPSPSWPVKVNSSTSAASPSKIVKEAPEKVVEIKNRQDEKLKEVLKKSTETKEEDTLIDSLFGDKVTEEKFNELLWELEMALYQADVAVPIVEEIKGVLKREMVGRRLRADEDIGEFVEKSLRKAVHEVLKAEKINFDEYITAREKPVVLMFVGINGTGKTSAIAKIAYRLKNNGYTCVMAAGDTFRAGAIEQLTKHAEKLDVKIVKSEAGGDPAAVAFDAIEHAKARKKDVVLIDTAGRMQTNTNLMDEMKKIKKVSQPDMIIFVGDALAGNDAIEQAKKFNEAVGIDAVILTKIDADAKGGAALSIARAINKPIVFVSVGQEYEDLIPFDSKWMVERLFENPET
ncbi:MAG: signal recognition particle-docking protein FtsY [Thermoplasmata archaeon]